MNRIDEINKRLAEIRMAISADDADLDALEREANQLLEERGRLLQDAEHRRALLASIANDEGLETRTFNPGFASTEATPTEPHGTPEYRRAFMRVLQGADLTAAERRAFDSTAGSAGMVIPTETQNEIMRKMVKLAPLLDEITLLRIPGNITLAVESEVDDATIHTENAEATEASDKLVSISLSGYEVIKLLSISAKVRAMSVSAFESWLTDILSEGIARALENWMINGSGTDMPQGIEKAQVWDTSNAVAWAGTAPTYGEICAFIALLPAGYDPAAKMLMNKKTFWQRIQAVRDDAKAKIVESDGRGGYYVMGYPVLISSKVADDTIFLGAMKKYIGNFAEDIVIASDASSGFRRNAIDYRGTCIFDGKVGVGEAFVKTGKTV